ncbi:sugar ABC transporter permease [Patulibacter medicamentivorans]|uniref:Sugar ABC transporter permease n=1 Tax=Patulibacter medicamentivorans TaxID=1097667 RepID=H0E0L1_9ACTN|nr:sugar ABC transporter permease [Patulibacter medicamentivorans]
MAGRARWAPGSAARIGRRGRRVAVWLIFATLAASTIYPLFFLLSTALRTSEDYRRAPGGLPHELTFDNVQRAFSEMDIGRLALNSLLVVVPAVLLLTVLSCLAAYALVHFEFPLRRTTLAIVAALMALPPAAIVIPIFKAILDVNLLNNRLGLILAYAALQLPFSIFLLASFMRAVPGELLKAAMLDGAGPLRTLWSVVLPLVRPGLLTLMTLNFLFLWNEFLYSLVLLQREPERTMMVGIGQFQGHFDQSLGIVSAGLMMSMIPPLLIFFFFQRDLARGLTTGALK